MAGAVQQSYLISGDKTGGLPLSSPHPRPSRMDRQEDKALSQKGIPMSRQHNWDCGHIPAAGASASTT